MGCIERLSWRGGRVYSPIKHPAAGNESDLVGLCFHVGTPCQRHHDAINPPHRTAAQRQPIAQPGGRPGGWHWYVGVGVARILHKKTDDGRPDAAAAPLTPATVLGTPPTGKPGARFSKLLKIFISSSQVFPKFVVR